MKNCLAIILMFGSMELPGQIETEFIDFQDLIQFDSVVVQNKTGSERYVYQYKNGRLTNKKCFCDGELCAYTDYKFFKDIKISYYHSRWVRLPEEGEPYSFWGDSFTVKVEQANEGKIVSTEYYESTGSDSTLQEKTIFVFNTEGSIRQEKIYDHSTGYYNVFKSNSAEFDSPYEKTEMLEKHKNYRYEANKITIEYVIADQVKGKEIVQLNSWGKPSRILSQDGEGKKLGESMFLYDGKGRIIERRVAWLLGRSLWGESVDFLLPRTEKIIYNKSGYPDKVISTYRGQPSELYIYTYYKK